MNDALKKLLKAGSDLNTWKPEIFDVSDAGQQDQLLSLLTKNKDIFIVDEYEEQVKELTLVKKPRYLTHLSAYKKISVGEGVWIYYAWRNCLVHLLEKAQFRILRQSRNLNLITKKEQKTYSKTKIAIAGLNVGNPAAVCIALESGGQFMKFADNDVLSVSNLNRFRAGVCELGVNKAVLTARQVVEIDPFMALEVMPNGLVPGCEEEFLSKPRVDVLIEEMDNLSLKISIREAARKLRIPVLMVTGNAENIIIDIERYDLRADLKILNGHLRQRIIDSVTKKGKATPQTLEKKILLARDFMGVRILNKRLVASFAEIGKSLGGIPQLAEASFLRGAALAYFTRQIVIGAKVPSGRYELKLDDIIKRYAVK